MRKSHPQPWHNADIVAAVRKAGTTLRRLSLDNGFAASTLRSALHKRHPRAHAVIASAIGKTRHAIWPQWYDAADRPIPLSPYGRTALRRISRKAA